MAICALYGISGMPQQRYRGIICHNVLLHGHTAGRYRQWYFHLQTKPITFTFHQQGTGTDVHIGIKGNVASNPITFTFYQQEIGTATSNGIMGFTLTPPGLFSTYCHEFVSMVLVPRHNWYIFPTTFAIESLIVP